MNADLKILNWTLIRFFWNERNNEFSFDFKRIVQSLLKIIQKIAKEVVIDKNY